MYGSCYIYCFLISHEILCGLVGVSTRKLPVKLDSTKLSGRDPASKQASADRFRAAKHSPGKTRRNIFVAFSVRVYLEVKYTPNTIMKVGFAEHPPCCARRSRAGFTALDGRGAASCP